MNTDNYLSQVAPKQPFTQENLSKIEKVQRWVYEHPTIVKVAKVALFILSAVLITSLPVGLPFLGCTAVVIGCGVGATIFGGLVLTVAVLAYKYLDIIAPPKHEMSHHVFKQGKCEGGELAYHGDVPILTLNMENPYQAGKAHGYLLGDAINKLRTRWNVVMRLGGIAEPHEVPTVIEDIKKRLSQEYTRGNARHC